MSFQKKDFFPFCPIYPSVQIFDDSVAFEYLGSHHSNKKPA
ncbi:hypothetical protein EJK55_1423 [Moraxella catarrhalis]|uniref:Uncharacterized protein n=1 Tax=Moraxella catarrhalis TaxID=480 RepID=A0ABY0BIP5_MORCA|nr:hypothetical protein EJK55_1423 [Moraxella catarrhalis]RUO15476.1 hypothetical protein EJK54_1302 [Moraxella catarrhalis]